MFPVSSENPHFETFDVSKNLLSLIAVQRPSSNTVIPTQETVNKLSDKS